MRMKMKKRIQEPTVTFILEYEEKYLHKLNNLFVFRRERRRAKVIVRAEVGYFREGNRIR